MDNGHLLADGVLAPLILQRQVNQQLRQPPFVATDGIIQARKVRAPLFGGLLAGGFQRAEAQV